MPRTSYSAAGKVAGPTTEVAAVKSLLSWLLWHPQPVNHPFICVTARSLPFDWLSSLHLLRTSAHQAQGAISMRTTLRRRPLKASENPCMTMAYLAFLHLVEISCSSARHASRQAQATASNGPLGFSGPQGMQWRRLHRGRVQMRNLPSGLAFTGEPTISSGSIEMAARAGPW